MLCFASAQARARKLTTKNRFILTDCNLSFHATIKLLKIFSTSLTLKYASILIGSKNIVVIPQPLYMSVVMARNRLRGFGFIGIKVDRH